MAAKHHATYRMRQFQKANLVFETLPIVVQAHIVYKFLNDVVDGLGDKVQEEIGEGIVVTGALTMSDEDLAFIDLPEDAPYPTNPDRYDQKVKVMNELCDELGVPRFHQESQAEVSA